MGCTDSYSTGAAILSTPHHLQLQYGPRYCSAELQLVLTPSSTDCRAVFSPVLLYISLHKHCAQSRFVIKDQPPPNTHTFTPLLICALLGVWTDSVAAVCGCSLTLLPHSSNLGFSLAGPKAAPKFTYGAGCLGSASQQAAVLHSNIYIHPIKQQTVAHIYFSEVMSCHPLPPPQCGDQGLVPVSRLDQT